MTQATKSDKHMALLDATARVVSALMQHSPKRGAELEAIINEVYHAFASLSDNPEQTISVMQSNGRTATVSVKDSVQPDFIVCLEDGKKLKMLKRYLKTNYGITPEQYRERWNLPASYPMVAPEYAKRRSDLAKEIGLGKDTTRMKRLQMMADAKKHKELVAG